MLRNLAKVRGQSPVARNLSTAVKFETLAVSFPKPFVCHVELNRPEKFNAFNRKLWTEIGQCFNQLSADEDTRVIILSGAGKHFTAGLDLQDVLQLGQSLADIEDLGRKAKFLNTMIRESQESLSALETCVKPVIACSHAACIGAGVELLLAADIRLCSKDAWFQVKEVGIGMAADVGSLQRLPRVIGNHSLVRELCFTARKLKSEEAERWGLVSGVHETKEDALKKALEMAETIAGLSPIAVQTTKKSLVYSEGRTYQEGLDHIRELNQFMMQSEDFFNAVVAQQTKEKVTFAKL